MLKMPAEKKIIPSIQLIWPQADDMLPPFLRRAAVMRSLEEMVMLETLSVLSGSWPKVLADWSWGTRDEFVDMVSGFVLEQKQQVHIDPFFWTFLSGDGHL